MTPKEKALELWEKYFRLNYDWDGATKDEWAKEGALIAVDEILNVIIGSYDYELENKYWQEVKQEIEKL
jgi:Mg2+/Co2+ transporter CorC